MLFGYIHLTYSQIKLCTYTVSVEAALHVPQDDICGKLVFRNPLIVRQKIELNKSLCEICRKDFLHL